MYIYIVYLFICINTQCSVCRKRIFTKWDHRSIRPTLSTFSSVWSKRWKSAWPGFSGKQSLIQNGLYVTVHRKNSNSYNPPGYLGSLDFFSNKYGWFDIENQTPKWFFIAIKQLVSCENLEIEMTRCHGERFVPPRGFEGGSHQALLGSFQGMVP